MATYNDGKLGPLTTKGDIRVFDGSNEVRLPIGANTQVLTADSAEVSGQKWAAAGGSGAVTRAGGNTTEATTTSTTAVDLLSATGLSIAATLLVFIVALIRKSATASTAIGAGLKINTTVTSEPVAGNAGRFAGISASGIAEARYGGAWIGPRLTNYDDHPSFGVTSGAANTGVSEGTSVAISANIPIATITDVVIRGIINDALGTMGADELQAYSLSAS